MRILIVGHSLGATMAVFVLTRALDHDPEMTQHGPKIRLLTVGSTIGKLALHPAAERCAPVRKRERRRRPNRMERIPGAARLISFFRFDPVSLKKFHWATRPAQGPLSA